MKKSSTFFLVNATINPATYKTDTIKDKKTFSVHRYEKRGNKKEPVKNLISITLQTSVAGRPHCFPKLDFSLPFIQYGEKLIHACCY
jgi:hypothetical protein